jgi:DNA-3-methyladenine glycosylase
VGPKSEIIVFQLNPLPAQFFHRRVDEVAPELLGKLLAAPVGLGRIVEVEAYGGAEDPASHAYRGPTKRSSIMFQGGGVLYTYLIYGMYWCANVVTGAPGCGAAVLIRALEPVAGLDTMSSNRPTAKCAEQLASGPGKLCQALEIDGRHNGQDLLRATGPIRLGTNGRDELEYETTQISSSPRIGIREGTELPWRFCVSGHPCLSRRIISA